MAKQAILEPDEFHSYVPGEDRFTALPILELDDLKPTYKGRPKLSYLMGTWNRRSQLARSLESLARQTWREFEVLLTDDGSTQDIEAVVELFEPHLQIRYFRLERDSWHSCPSRAFHHMLPEAQGGVIVIAHPEILLHQEATGYLYQGCTKRLDDAHYGGLSPLTEGEFYWVTLKPCFLNQSWYDWLDYVDWHNNFENFYNIPNFDAIGGLGGFPNSYHAAMKGYHWWYVGAALKDCPIWRDLPVFDGHALIDMWLMDYRRLNDIVDVTPNKVLCMHQPHLTTAIARKGEKGEKLNAQRMESIL
jgi:hypothetical protein